MRLWSVQPLAVYHDLQGRGVLAADPTRGDGFEDWGSAYAWMREQMAKRVPAYTSGPLWWAWGYKVDLRCHRFQEMPGDYVRLELQVPDDEVLVSSFGDWHAVLNNCYLPVDEADHDAFGARQEAAGDGAGPAGGPPLPDEIRRSWERIFEPSSLAECTPQATFEWLRLRDVRKVTRFEGQHMRRYFGPRAIGLDDLPPLEGFGDPIRVGDTFASIYVAHGDEALQVASVYILRGYEGQGRQVSLICEDDRGRCCTFNASGRRFERR